MAVNTDMSALNACCFSYLPTLNITPPSLIFQFNLPPFPSHTDPSPTCLKLTHTQHQLQRSLHSAIRSLFKKSCGLFDFAEPFLYPPGHNHNIPAKCDKIFVKIEKHHLSFFIFANQPCISSQTGSAT